MRWLLFLVLVAVIGVPAFMQSLKPLPLDTNVQRAALDKLKQDRAQKDMRYVYSNENRMGIK